MRHQPVWILRSVIALIGLSVAAPAAAAETLDGPALKSALSGKTLYLNTPYGVSIPVRYRANGTMSGTAAMVLVPHTGSRRDTGRWWVKGRQVCQRWNTWNDKRSECFTFRRTGNTIKYTSSRGTSGTATLGQ